MSTRNLACVVCMPYDGYGYYDQRVDPVANDDDWDGVAPLSSVCPPSMRAESEASWTKVDALWHVLLAAS